MRKIFALSTLFILFAAATTSFAQTAIPLDQALDNCAAHLRNQLPRGARAAILKIEARTDAFTEYVTESFSARVVAHNHLTVVERGRTLQILEREQLYQMSGNVSDETATSVGKQLGAELIIAGSIMPRGDNYSMSIRVVHVETARIHTQWSSHTIRVDPSLARIDAPAVIAVARFAGTALETIDQDSLIQDIQQALGNYHVAIELMSANEAPANTDYNFLITLRVNPRTEMQAVDLTLALRRGNRVLKQSNRHTYNEMNMEYIIRRGGQVIQNDQAFFLSLPGIMANQ